MTSKYSEHHGGPYDRGMADCYYGRLFDPHYYPEGTYNGPRIKIEKDTPEWEAYDAGFKYQAQCGDLKDWG